MEGLVGLIIAGIVIYVIVRKTNKKKKALEKLNNSVTYQIAAQIKNELLQNGYSINNEMSVYYSENRAIGNFHISSNSDESGSIIFSNYINAMFSAEASIRLNNASVISGNYYTIQNAEIGVIVCSDKATQKPPQFLEIAAKVIKNCGCPFAHPEWYYKDQDAKKYLNTMFK